MSKVICVKIAGIIAEYDPLHAGHIYHMLEARRLTGADRIVCALGGAFTQRGEAALFDKYARAEMALLAGADAVVELPEVWAARPAQLFARGGVLVLNALGADALCFGCETDDTAALYEVLNLCSRRDGTFASALHKGLEDGKSYPRALSEAVFAHNPQLADLLEGPNFILALEYLSISVRSSGGLYPLMAKAPSQALDCMRMPGKARFISAWVPCDQGVSTSRYTRPWGAITMPSNTCRLSCLNMPSSTRRASRAMSSGPKSIRLRSAQAVTGA